MRARDTRLCMAALNLFVSSGGRARYRGCLGLSTAGCAHGAATIATPPLSFRQRLVIRPAAIKRLSQESWHTGVGSRVTRATALATDRWRAATPRWPKESPRPECCKRGKQASARSWAELPLIVPCGFGCASFRYVCFRAVAIVGRVFVPREDPSRTVASGFCAHVLWMSLSWRGSPLRVSRATGNGRSWVGSRRRLGARRMSGARGR